MATVQAPNSTAAAPPGRASPRSFVATLAQRGLTLQPTALTTLQMNITKLCNQACTHCHVDSSPRRRETMSDAVLDRCLQILQDHPSIATVDITGGAPELHPRFQELVQRSRALGKRVLVRHNLTVTLDPHPRTKASLAYLPEFFAAQGVELISSLPCYEEANTDGQRGTGVFSKSIASLKLLNAVGYGRGPNSGNGTRLLLNLVFNPTGTNLPAAQAVLEPRFKLELWSQYGIVFDRLLAITNMPIHRFKVQLRKEHAYEAYMERLVDAFNPEAAAAVMCRTMLSVAYDGKLYDCDFNQMLNMPVAAPSALTVFDFAEDTLLTRQIRLADHCFGCTAGAGSSCGGSTATN